DASATDPGEEALVSALPAQVARLLGTLGPRERQVLVGLHGLDGKAPRTGEELAWALGLTRQGVHVIEARAGTRLRHPTLAHLARPVVED
ncbi:MAG: sigma factor-like helix-turn-helix DNA-binding protein, partial [Acidimicrobiales bacterium]